MKLLEFEPAIQEALCLNQVLVKLGFSEEDIFVVVGNASNPKNALLAERTRLNQPAVHVQLATQNLEWVGCVGPTRLGAPEFDAVWKMAVAAWNDQPLGAEHLYRHSRAHRGMNALREVLLQKGFFLPRSN